MCRFQPSRSIWASLSAPGFSRVRKRVGSAGVTSSRDLLGVGTQTRHMTPQKRAVHKCLKSRNTQAIGLCGVVQRYTTFSDKTRTEDGQKNAGQVARELLSSRYRALSGRLATRLRYRPATARPGTRPGRAAARRALHLTALGERHPGSGAVSD